MRAGDRFLLVHRVRKETLIGTFWPSWAGLQLSVHPISVHISPGAIARSLVWVLLTAQTVLSGFHMPALFSVSPDCLRYTSR